MGISKNCLVCASTQPTALRASPGLAGTCTFVKNSPASGFATQFNAQPPTRIILSYSWVCHIICTE